MSATRSYEDRIFTSPFPDIWKRINARMDLIRYPGRMFFFIGDDLCFAIELDKKDYSGISPMLWITSKFLKISRSYNVEGIRSEIESHLNCSLGPAYPADGDRCVEVEYHFFRKIRGAEEV